MIGKTSKTRPESAEAPTGPQKVLASAETSGPGITAMDVWCEIAASYEKVNELIKRLSPQERERLCHMFERVTVEGVIGWWGTMLKGLTPEQAADFDSKFYKTMGFKFLEETFHVIKNELKVREERVKDHYTPKPRMTERDEEIVRLRDQEGLAWKGILKEIRKNPAWDKGGRGKSVTVGVLKTAYTRHKKLAKG
jgi:hypothetical protein